MDVKDSMAVSDAVLRDSAEEVSPEGTEPETETCLSTSSETQFWNLSVHKLSYIFCKSTEFLHQVFFQTKSRYAHDELSSEPFTLWDGMGTKYQQDSSFDALGPFATN